MARTFNIRGEAVLLDSLPFTVGGQDFDVPVMNLKTQRFFMLNVAPVLGTTADAEWAAWLSAIECRMGEIDGDVRWTADRIDSLLAGPAEISAFRKQLTEWGILSGALVRQGEPAPGIEGQEPPAT